MLSALVLLYSAFVTMTTVRSSAVSPYYGTRIGKFSTYFHDVKGDVYAIDEKTIFIKNFKYDGKGQEAHFWAGSSIRPDTSGFIIPDQRGTFEVLLPSDGGDVLLRLPDDKKIQDIRWLAVWSKRFRANFGSLIFPKSFNVPSPVVIGPLEKTKHGVSSGPIIILDTQTFLVPDFTYDGKGKGVYWWLSRGVIPNTGGLRLRDENGSDSSLKGYPQKTTVVIPVPEGHSVTDFETLSVWSEQDVQDYGFAKLPKDVLVPPSPRSLGIPPENKLNCEMLNDDLGLEVRWAINGNNLVMQLISKIGLNEYMTLGLSKDDAETKFTSADAAVTWMDTEGRGHAVDYFLQNTDKCEDGHGMCPDTVHQGAEDNLILMNAAKVNDYVTVTFKRSLNAVDKHLDQHVYTDGPQAILWAVGPITENGEVGPPRLRTRGNLLLDFGREPIWNCPSPGGNATLPTDAEDEDEKDNAAVVAAEKIVTKINCPTDLTFRAQMGPSTENDEGSESRRIWYINGLPSPILTLQRGQTYTFLVEGGMSPPLHHPLYITSSAEGGLYQKVLGNKDHEEIIFAGVARDPATNGLLPTAEGRLCEWSPVAEKETMVVTEEGDAHLPLELSCGPGNAGSLQWTPDTNTSSVVFYQSFTEMKMGGKIRLVDWCEETDPEGYVIEAEKGRPSPATGYHPELELERERDSVDDTAEREPQSSEIQQQESIPDDDRRVEERNESEDGGAAEERIMNFQRGGQAKIKLADFMQQEPSLRDESKSDQSERSDLENIHKLSNIERVRDEGYLPLRDEVKRDQSERSDLENIHRLSHIERVRDGSYPGSKITPKDDNIKKHHYRPLHLAEETPSPAKVPSKFSVQFEGGFVPLVRNPVTDRESANFVPPKPQISHFRGPQRPFLFDANESVPFHGTFKPGVPDFSGFNISHYTQSPPPNYHSDQQALGQHSVPKPQIIQRPATQGVSRPQAAFPRPPLFGYAPRPHRYPPHPQQHLFVQLPPKHRPEFQSTENEDLDEGSSQRVVQIALQNPGNDKIQKNVIIPGYPSQHGPGMKHQSGGAISPNGGVPAPPIQRRPDIVNDDEVQFFPPQNRPSHTNYNPQRMPNGNSQQGDRGYPPQRPQRFPIPIQHPPNSNLRPHPNAQRFPLGANVRPHHTLMLQRPPGMSPEHFQDMVLKHRLANRRPMPVGPQHYPVSVEESGSKSSEEIQSDSDRLAIPSLEIIPEIQLPNKISPLPFHGNSQHTPATISHEHHTFPSQKFQKRPVDLAIASKDHAELDENDEEIEEEHEEHLSLSTLPPSSKPYLILPPFTEPSEKRATWWIQEQGSKNIYKSEGSQDATVEVADPSEFYETGEDIDADYDKSGQSSDSPHGEDYVTHERQTSATEDEVVKGIVEKDASNINIHIPNEHIGEDEEPDVPFGTRLPFQIQGLEQEAIRAPEAHQDQSHGTNFFPLRRKPQFSSTPSEDSSGTENSPEREKSEMSSHLHLNFWPGRKNILPSENNAGHSPEHDLSSKTLEDIRLPQVSERPVNHDNGTDYSILTHVLSLIGGQPETMDIIEPRNVT